MQNTCFIMSCHWQLVCQRFPTVAYLITVPNQAPAHHLLLLITSSATCRRGEAARRALPLARHLNGGDAFLDRFHMSVAQSLARWWHGFAWGRLLNLLNSCQQELMKRCCTTVMSTKRGAVFVFAGSGPTVRRLREEWIHCELASCLEESSSATGNARIDAQWRDWEVGLSSGEWWKPVGILLIPSYTCTSPPVKTICSFASLIIGSQNLPSLRNFPIWE